MSLPTKDDVRKMQLGDLKSSLTNKRHNKNQRNVGSMPHIQIVESLIRF